MVHMLSSQAWLLARSSSTRASLNGGLGVRELGVPKETCYRWQQEYSGLKVLDRGNAWRLR
jgi:hypothetical protein